MTVNNHQYLLLAAILTGIAALAHLGCILFGADWYRFLGAGEAMAQMAEAGDPYPAQVTSVLVTILTLWSLYGLSGVRIMAPLPGLKLALPLISLIFMARAVGFVWIMPAFPENSLTFWWISSSICLVIALLYGLGAWQLFKRSTD